MQIRIAWTVAMAVAAGGCGIVGETSVPRGGVGPGKVETFEGPVAKAVCQSGDAVETGLQGQVPQADRVSLRASEGYNCNLTRIGQFDNNGEGSGWQFAWYEDCGYMGLATGAATDGTRTPRPGQTNTGVAVIDGSDPTAPKATTYLASVSMSDPWESLKVNERRQLLADVNAGLGGSAGGPEIDVYDLSGDCREPKLLASVALGESNGHAGHWAPDGLTYYGSPISAGIIKAIDVTDPARPALIKEDFLLGTHDLSVSQDGTRLFLANNNGNGLAILDVAQVQQRVANPADAIVSELYWTDGGGAQMTQRVTIAGRPYILFVDEGGKGAARLIDISDEKNPVIASKLKLDVHMPENAQAVQNDAGSVPFGYEGHYCTASDGINDNTTYDVENAVIAACSYFDSGLRVFDIRDPYRPREIAYYIPPTVPGPRVSSYYNMAGGCTAVDWVAAHPRVIPARNEIWFTSQCNGMHVLRFEKSLAELLGPSG